MFSRERFLGRLVREGVTAPPRPRSQVGDQVRDPAPYLAAAANAARSRAYDIVRVNAALAAASAVILMDDEHDDAGRSAVPTHLGQANESVARLERRGRLPLDLAAELRVLLAPYGEDALTPSDEEDAARAYEVAVRTLQLAHRCGSLAN